MALFVAQVIRFVVNGYRIKRAEARVLDYNPRSWIQDMQDTDAKRQSLELKALEQLSTELRALGGLVLDMKDKLERVLDVAEQRTKRT